MRCTSAIPDISNCSINEVTVVHVPNIAVDIPSIEHSTEVKTAICIARAFFSGFLIETPAEATNITPKSTGKRAVM